jgi:hypothetical protein
MPNAIDSRPTTKSVVKVSSPIWDFRCQNSPIRRDLQTPHTTARYPTTTFKTTFNDHPKERRKYNEILQPCIAFFLLFGNLSRTDFS